MNPIKVFGVLAALLAAVAALALLSRDEPRTPTPAEAATPTADLSLTDAEAIARFKELKKLRDRAYHDRDGSLLDGFFTRSSKLSNVGKREVRRLIRDKVLDRTRFETVDLKVTRNTLTEIQLVQEEVVRPRFVTEDGHLITIDADPELQRIKWSLRPEDGEWLVHDIVITAARPLRNKS